MTVSNVDLLPFHWHKKPPTHEEHTSESQNHGIYFRIPEFREEKYDPFGTHELEPMRRFSSATCRSAPSLGHTMVTIRLHIGIILGRCWLRVVTFLGSL